MRVRREIYGRRTLGLLRVLTLGLCALALSCARDTFEEGSPLQPKDGQALVRLTINTPGTALPKAVTRAPVDSRDEAENRITEVEILVLEEAQGGYVFRYRVSGQQVQSSGSTTRFQALLMSSSKKAKLLLVANSGNAFAGYAPSAGTDENTLKTEINRAFDGTQQALPMYGEIPLASGLDAAATNELSAVMLRGVARTDVVKELEDDSQPFRMTSVYAYRANDRVQVVPNALAASGSLQVDAPSVPAGTAFLPQPIRLDAPGGVAESITHLYLPEAETRFSEQEQLTGATCIVVGGYFKDDLTPTYYRIDFNSGLPGHPFGQILRNHRYIFKVKKVLGPGWPTPEEAANNRATSIVAEIESWTDFTTGMYFDGDNYLGVSSRRIVLGYRAGDQKRLEVQASLPYRIQWLDALGNPTGQAVSAEGAELTGNAYFKAVIGRDSGDPSEQSHVLFTTLGENTSSTTDRTAVLRVEAGNWRFDVTVVQEAHRKYSSRVIRVMSIPEVGDLGTPNPADASGRALRNILDNPANFSPTGTVAIRGFAFIEVPQAMMSSTGTGSSTDKGYFTALKNTVYGQDVIYLSYNTPISDEASRMILEWLDGSQNRVLIVGTDTKPTNQNLLPYLISDGEWNYYYLKDIGGQFMPAPRTDANRSILTTPFGEVAADAVFTRVDAYAGYNSTYPSEVIPLVMSNKDGYLNYMAIGINPRTRIVYHGDASLNQYSRMSAEANTSGTITSDLDRFHANLWAWIAEQVCREQ